MDLSPVQVRVLGVLIEKQLTTPQYYPMTLNALVTGCNQSNNRDPVMQLDDRTVQLALDNLKERGFVRFVHATQGARAMKFRQVFDDAIGLDPRERAALAVLMLRGPQTVGEVRGRAERLHELGSVEEVEALLVALAERTEPLVVRLPRLPGQKEARFAHLLAGEPEMPAVPGAAAVPTRSHQPPHRLSHPRVRPVEGDADPDIQTLLDELGPAGRLNIFRTLVRHPGLFRKWSPFGGKLLSGKLSPRDRELLILRTAHNTHQVYEWGQHVRIGLDAGLTEDEITRIAAGPDAPGWSEPDAAVLRAADELHASQCISDATWTALAARLDERQLIEVPMVVGHYTLLAYVLNSLGVQREPGVPGFPAAVPHAE